LLRSLSLVFWFELSHFLVHSYSLFKLYWFLQDWLVREVEFRTHWMEVVALQLSLSLSLSLILNFILNMQSLLCWKSCSLWRRC
jgi:hypothetical protein